jgi:hypothetical protein
LFSHRLLGRHVDHIDVVHELDGVPSADGLDEVVAGIKEDHINTRSDLLREMDQHRVGH